MKALVRVFDSILNDYTMYRVVTYGLAALLAISDVLALTNAVSISAAGLAISVGVLVASCYVANKVMSATLKVVSNTESWLISALILACILPPVDSLTRALYVALAGVVAMASKYVLIYRGSHVFNPVAIAAFVMSVSGLLPAPWWIATPWLMPFTAFLALAVLRKQRSFQLFFAFVLSATILMLYIGVVLHDKSTSSVLHDAVLSWPIIFMGSIMLTEPSTMPPTQYYRILAALLTGFVFASQQTVWGVSATPQVALLAGNLFTVMFAPAYGVMLKLKSSHTLSQSVYELVFEKPLRGAFTFTAGQYAEWTLPHAKTDSRGNRRSFSIASSPTESDIRIAFTKRDASSSFKAALVGLQAGKFIRVAHIAGNFTLPLSGNEPLLFIAGGIGITPFRSMIKQLIDTQQKRDIKLIYIVGNERDVVYQDILATAKNNGLHVQIVLGRISSEDLHTSVPDITQREVYLSGPDALVTAYAQVIGQMGVSRRHIHTDHFTGY